MSLLPLFQVSIPQVHPHRSLNWANAKKFNAQRIRSRKKEHEERLGSEGKQLPSTEMKQSSLTNGRNAPALSIAVTMSDDEDNELHSCDKVAVGQDASNVSAWAMMEHYDGLQNGNHSLLLPCEQRIHSISGSFLQYDDDSSFLSNDSGHVAEQGIFSDPTQNSWGGIHGKQLAVLQTPAKIEWHENEDGELVESSSTSDQSISRKSTTDDDDTVVDSVPTCSQVENHSNKSLENDEGLGHDICVSDPSKPLSKPSLTPACTRLEREDRRRLEDEVSTPPPSDMQESLVPSDCQVEDELVSDTTDFDQMSKQEEETQKSAPSLMESDIDTAPVPIDCTEDTGIPLKSTWQGFGYLEKIEELEQNLKEQRFSTDQVQSKLKDRVVELEQALRATAATPRGTMVQENPLKTLLDRNQTLVKEVRFADQTCVELSSRVSALEAENNFLKDRVRHLEEENDALRQENEETVGSVHQETPNLDSFTPNVGKDDPDHIFQLMNSSTSFSSEIHSVEVSKVRSESEFLGRQLGLVQEKLDAKVKELEEERARFKQLEEQKRKEVEIQHLRIVALEEMTSQTCFRQDGLASQLLSDTDKRVFTLEKELAHAMASVVALRRESKKIQIKEALPSNLESSALVESRTERMIQESLTKMFGRYQYLERHVNEVVDGYIRRLERLTETVEYLRSSLDFEAESFSPKFVEEGLCKGMDASIGSSPRCAKEDDLLSMMEEARNPSIAKSLESDEGLYAFEDISQLFSDDETLESKNGSSVTSVSPQNWKVPLQAAVNECQRVKERSSMLKQEILKQKASIRALEAENGRLCLEASRRGEENQMVETALDEAKHIIDELKSNLRVSEEDRENALQSNRQKEAELKLQRRNWQDLESELRTERSKQRVLENRIEELDQALVESRERLEEAMKSSLRHQSRCDNLLVQMENMSKNTRAERDEETVGLQRRLDEADDEVKKWKKLHQESNNRLIRAVEENKTIQKSIAAIQAQEEKFVSDAEDSMLESQYNLESMRRERAELRAQLSRKQKEVLSLKDTFSAYKEKTQIQLQQCSSSLQRMESGKSATMLHCQELKTARKELFEKLLSVDCCTETIHSITTLENGSDTDTDIECLFLQEVSYWKEIAPRIAKSVQSLSKTKIEFGHLLKESANLSNDLNLLKDSEKECKERIDEERRTNEKLLALLSQAEVEMERSAKQIREMSAALSRLQESESEANNKVKAAEHECLKVSDDLRRAQSVSTLEHTRLNEKVSDLSKKLEEKEALLSDMNAVLSETKAEVTTLSHLQRTHEAEVGRLTSTLQSLETKCSRLRNYIKKLTKKCEEWEACYEKQACSIEELQAKNSKLRENASGLANRYIKLKEGVNRKKQCHRDARAKWTSERSTLHEVHAQLEEELELIAKELDC
eukprot:scaffold2470_cov114-Cylindrotheca_fusiformis.AAC.4